MLHHGDPADAFHLVEHGRVGVRVVSARGGAAGPGRARAGRFLGEVGLVGERGARSAPVTALEACETVALHREQFEHLRQVDPTLDRQLVAILAAQVESLSERLLEALSLPTRLRVVHTLLLLEAEYGGVVRMTQRDIGLMAETTGPR